jgi:HSP20 family molecular chaperone IbpA
MDDEDHEEYQKIMEMVKQLVQQALERGSVQPGMQGVFIMIQGMPKEGCGGACGSKKPAPIIDTPAEVHDTEDEVRVLTDMPGVEEDQLHVRIREGTLWIVGVSGTQGYRARVPLGGVDQEPVRCSCRHGVVEAVFRKLTEAPSS